MVQDNFGMQTPQLFRFADHIPPEMGSRDTHVSVIHISTAPTKTTIYINNLYG